MVAAWAITLAVGCTALNYNGSFWDILAFAKFPAMFSAPLMVIAAVFFAAWFRSRSPGILQSGR